MRRGDVLSMVLVEPPAPADLVLAGLALAIFSFWSAAARLRIAVRGPPGGVGDEGRPTLAPLAAPALTGEEGRGEDCESESALLAKAPSVPCWMRFRMMMESHQYVRGRTLV